MPSTAPMVPSRGSPEDLAAAHTKSAVSTPSRPTLTTPSSTRPQPAPPAERAIAPSSSCSSSLRSPRAWRSIQKIIQVTRPTARMESEPPRISCAWKLSP